MTRLIFLLFLAILLLYVSPVFAKPITLKFSHVVDKDTPKGMTAELFKKLVEERSAGRIQVKIYPNATLYGDRAALQALQLNTVQMAAPSFSKFIDYTPQLQVFDLPFLFKDRDHLHTVLDGDTGRKLLKSASKRGLHALAFWDNGFKQLTANKPLIVPKDAVGLKFRIMSSNVLAEQFKAIGANPQVLPFSEVYAALQQGIVSGQENTLSNIYTKKFHLVQSDLTLTNHGYLGYLLVTNDIFWSKLPEDLKRIIEAAVVESTNFSRKISAQVNREFLEKIRASGKIRIHDLSTEQRELWQKKMSVIYPQFYVKIGKLLIEKIQK